MSTETTSGWPDPRTATGGEDREMLFNAYLDGELPDEKARAFDERLDEDPEFREAYGEFADVVGSVRNLPYEFAPDDFTSKVRSRIRTRSRGRFFNEQMLEHQRFPYEAVAVVMIIIMASAYLMIGVAPSQEIQKSDQSRLDLPPSDRQQEIKDEG